MVCHAESVVNAEELKKPWSPGRQMKRRAKWCGNADEDSNGMERLTIHF